VSRLVPLRVNVFAGGFNWPIFVGIEKGFFARQGISVELRATAGSVAQTTDLANAKFEIAMTAFDNIVAYVEGQGEAPIGPQPEFFAFFGSDNSFLRLVARPEIASIADLRGRSVSVDAATTGYAFALFDMLERAGLHEGDYMVAKVGGMAKRFQDLCRGNNAATLLSAPYDLLAENEGLRVLARFDAPYQGNVGAARRDWAGRNAEAIVAYIRGHLAALRWLYDQANRQEAWGILERNVAGMTSGLAASTSSVLLGKDGFFRDGEIREEGVRTVLRLRSRYANKSLTDATKYVDLGYWERARR